MALGCHGILQMLLESKEKENGFGLGRIGCLVGVVFMHGSSPGMVEIQGFVEVAQVS